MKKYNVTGMSCAACVSRVEKAVNTVEGVSSCSVSLLTNSMTVEGTAPPEKIINAVIAAGYGASEEGTEQKNTSDSAKTLEDKTTPLLKKRLFASLGFLIVLMYFSMGHMIGLPAPAFFEHNPAANGLLQLLLAAIVMVINQKFFINGFKGVLHGAPNMDTLVALGSGASFAYSVYALFRLIDAQTVNNTELIHYYAHEFYFESAAMILTLITVGKMLEARSKGKTTNALKGLMELAPVTAVVEREGIETEIPASEVRKGDIFLVRPGQSIPVDGVVIEGHAAVDESALTGESIPADKEAGSSVSAATVNKSGFLRCEATKIGEDTTLSQIIKMVSDAAATKAPVAKIADKVAGIFVPAVITIAVITIIIWLICGKAVGFALARGISVLVISCPCALGLATPVAIMVGSGVGAKNGILFKTAVSLENTGKTEIAALDKTGTITKGQPVVTDIIPAENVTENELLTIAYSLEKLSEHPLAAAVVKKSEEMSITAFEVTDFTAHAGSGITARHNGKRLSAGKSGFVNIPDSAKVAAENLSEEGKTPLFFAEDGKFMGIIAAADEIKADSREAIAQLKNMGIRVVMITGDNEKTACAIGKQAGVDEVIAGVLPEGKEAAIRSLSKQGRTAMIGDGINDAPALTRADTGIAIGAGTDVAIDAADVVLMNSSIRDAAAAIRLSRATLRNIKQNLFWAFIYNIIGIPLAAGMWIPVFGWTLSPMFGAAAMSLSSFCVVSNALRLNLLDVHNPNRDKKIKAKNKPTQEEKSMEKTLKIEGMMCGHCEATVKKALEAVEGVEAAVVSHEKGTAVVTLTKEIDADVFRKIIEDKDFTFIGIE